MACCALAAFLISQIIFALDWVRERVGLGEPAPAAANATVAWRLDGSGIPAAITVRRPASGGTTMRFGFAAAGGAVAFVLLAGLTLGTEPGRKGDGAWAGLTLICTAHGLERLASPSGR